jgi:hypothetical protein
MQRRVAARMAGTTEMVGQFRTSLVVLPAILLVGGLAGLFFFTLAESDAQTSAVTAVAVVPDNSALPPQSAPAAAEAVASEPMGRLNISRQSLSRGGLGSKALVTFTLRNGNNYAIKDAEILCSFRSGDGRYSTERHRTITDTVNPRSHKTFPYTFIGFVNIKASKVKCTVLAASRA